MIKRYDIEDVITNLLNHTRLYEDELVVFEIRNFLNNYIKSFEDLTEVEQVVDLVFEIEFTQNRKIEYAQMYLVEKAKRRRKDSSRNKFLLEYNKKDYGKLCYIHNLFNDALISIKKDLKGVK